ncbi:MAG: hypothetical protein WCK49_09520 [Myxococcaceae bacterium]
MHKTLLRIFILFILLGFSKHNVRAGLNEELDLAKAIISRHQPNQNDHEEGMRVDMFNELRSYGSISAIECRRCSDALGDATTAISRASSNFSFRNPQERFEWEQSMKQRFIYSLLQSLA